MQSEADGYTNRRFVSPTQTVRFIKSKHIRWYICVLNHKFVKQCLLKVIVFHINFFQKAINRTIL